MTQVHDFWLDWVDEPASETQTLGRDRSRRFLDFVIAGSPLSLRIAEGFIPPLGWQSSGNDAIAARRLLGEEADLSVDGRVAVLVCPKVGSTECGAVTAVIEWGEDVVEWRDLAVSELDHGSGIWHHQRGAFEEWPVLRFSAPDYRDAIAQRPSPLVSANERLRRRTSLLEEARRHFARRDYTAAAEAYDGLDAGGLSRTDLKRRDIARKRASDEPPGAHGPL